MEKLTNFLFLLWVALPFAALLVIPAYVISFAVRAINTWRASL